MSLILEPNDLQSSCWIKLRRYLEDRQQNLRIENDSVKLTAEETASKRGRIAEIGEILELGENRAIRSGLVEVNAKTPFNPS